MKGLTTIRGRLRAGFGITLGLILAAGLLAGYGLLHAGSRNEALVSDMRLQQETMQQVAFRILRETAAGMRYLSTGTAADEARYAAYAEEADHLRREAIKVEALSGVERQKLKDLGTLQATVEAGIGVAHAYDAVGRSADATAVLENSGAASSDPPPQAPNSKPCATHSEAANMRHWSRPADLIATLPYPDALFVDPTTAFDATVCVLGRVYAATSNRQPPGKGSEHFDRAKSGLENPIDVVDSTASKR